MSERALSFGSDAQSYHRFRPGYPDAVVSLVLSHADGVVTRALEVGAGTGKATFMFGSHGIEVHAVEPDAEMRSVLESQCQSLPIQVVASTFEALDLKAIGPVDLLFAAAAFHWTDPDTRWQRAAAAIRPGGVAAFFGAVTDLADDALSEQVDHMAQTVMGVDTFDMGAENDSGSPWPASDLRRRPEFTDVTETVIPRLASLPADDFVAHLSTVSAYRVLPPEQRGDLLARIRSGLPDTVEVNQDVTVHLARRIQDGPRTQPSQPP